MVAPAQFVEAAPDQAAAELLEAKPSPEWLDGFLAAIDRSRAGPVDLGARQLAQVLSTWDISQSEFAELVGVSRQAVGKWLRRLPSERVVAVSDLAAATQILVHYLRADRIPAVVRRPAVGLGDRSLVDLIAAGDTAAVLRATRTMFNPALAIT